MVNRSTMLPCLVAGLLLAAPVAPNATAAQTTPVANATPAKPAGPRSVAVERRINDLHARLKITPAEQKPFDDFAQVMRDNERRMADLMQSREATIKTGSAVDQMHTYSDMAQAHAEDVQHLTAAFSTLYDALSPDQKKLADESFRQFASQRRGAAG